MAFQDPPKPYRRGVPPVQSDSLPKFYIEELKKAEEAITSLVNALNTLEKQVNPPPP